MPHQHWPPWPNGQGVGLPKIVGLSPTGGVVFPGLHNFFFVFDSRSVGMARVTHISSAPTSCGGRLVAANYFPLLLPTPAINNTEGIRTPAGREPNGFRVHLLSRSDTVSSACTLQSSLFRQKSSGAPHWRRSPAPTRSVPPTAWMPCNKYSQAQKVQ